MKRSVVRFPVILLLAGNAVPVIAAAPTVVQVDTIPVGYTPAPLVTGGRVVQGANEAQATVAYQGRRMR